MLLTKPSTVCVEAIRFTSKPKLVALFAVIGPIQAIGVVSNYCLSLLNMSSRFSTVDELVNVIKSKPD